MDKTMKRSLILAFIPIIIAISGCRDGFDSLSVNPNQPEMVPTHMILTPVIRNTFTRSPEDAYDQGNFITQHTARQNFTDFDRYAWNPQDGHWNRRYGYLRDINNVILLGREAGHTNYEGVGYILKAISFAFLTDLFGDIPYTQAIQGRDEQIYSPVYDSQEAVYDGILEDLRRANELLNPNGFSIQGDIVYNGDIEKWQMLANSLRLRHLLRLERVRDVSAEMTSIVSNPSQFPIFKSIEDQAALSFLESAPNQWFSHTGRIGGFRERRMSQTIETRFEELNDPRIREYFRPTTAYVQGVWDKQFNGIPNGLGEAEALDWDGGSIFQSELAEKYWDEPNSAQAIVMSYFELQFILAEASLKGYIPGNPEEFYNKGVQAALSYYNIDQQRIDEYMAQPNVQFDPAIALEQIMMQKWIGSFMVAFEAWHDWRRTGLPEFEPGLSNANSDRIPVRFFYPQEEQVFNPVNLQAAIQNQGTDDINTPIWWMGNFNPGQ